MQCKTVSQDHSSLTLKRRFPPTAKGKSQPKLRHRQNPTQWGRIPVVITFELRFSPKTSQLANASTDSHTYNIQITNMVPQTKAQARVAHPKMTYTKTQTISYSRIDRKSEEV